MTMWVLMLAIFAYAMQGEFVAGPRGLVGADVPLGEGEKASFSQRIVVKGYTADAIQVACTKAMREGIRIVFLPAGRYVLEKTVRVPKGL
ncbi:MAG TPA: hypothetical protein EYP10_01960, partial [Armatimonadetes bacterium]|nr:hypothetical protein [Armatimonadota bacterium]